MRPFVYALKAWPAIFAITVALSFLTQAVAKLFGVDLPEQANVGLVRAYAGWNLTFVLLVLQIVILLPALEEVLFRWGFWKLPLACLRGAGRRLAAVIAVAAVSSAFFSFAHYIDYVAWGKTGAFTVRALDNAFLALFFFGGAQCWLYRRTGALSAAMLNHALFNLTNLILLFLIPA